MKMKLAGIIISILILLPVISSTTLASQPQLSISDVGLQRWSILNTLFMIGVEHDGDEIVDNAVCMIHLEGRFLRNGHNEEQSFSYIEPDTIFWFMIPNKVRGMGRITIDVSVGIIDDFDTVPSDYINAQLE